MQKDANSQSDAVTHHESAAMNSKLQAQPSQGATTKPEPKLPINIGDGWKKGDGTDMI